MVFKHGWEHESQHAFLVGDKELRSLLSHAFPGEDHLSWAPLGEAGSRHLHYKVTSGDGTIHVLRVAARAKAQMEKERALGLRMPARLDTGLPSRTGHVESISYSVAPFCQGAPLSHVLLREGAASWQDAVRACGEALATFRELTFTSPGFLDGELIPFQDPDFSSPQEHALKILQRPFVRTLLGETCTKELAQLLEAPLPLGTASNLVHGDFNPANVLVVKQGKEWHLSAILDWEFAFSGNSLWDVANWLREAASLDACYTNAFLDGLASKGYVLPSGWQETTKVLNVMACLDMLGRKGADTRPTMCLDLKNLLTRWSE
ncbi:MAG: hypothetical protein C0514_03020 [Candidatus Puniceispirillum sp.]|nr:hypothetical protein [Candidatus Puniceispirillum sp.]